MHKSRNRIRFAQATFWCLTALLLGIGTAAPGMAAETAFTVSFERTIHPAPFSGRIYLFFSQAGEPRLVGPNWFRPQPMVSLDVIDLAPGEPLRIDATTANLYSFPMPLKEMRLAGLRVQAVARFNAWPPEATTGVGNGISPVVTVDEPRGAVDLVINSLIRERPYEDTRWGQLFEVPSESLSRFHGRPVSLRGTVLLPVSYYEQPVRRYPVILIIPGFGGDHRIDPVRSPPPVPAEIPHDSNGRPVEFIRVMLDPKFPTGHHVFADSDNNGPVGQAFVTEFLPAFDATYRTVGSPAARYLTGHSSGGWSSLWLQVAYPTTFGGVWSTAPDPVDFRDFQQIDLTVDQPNMFFDAEGEPRPLARRAGRAALFYRNFSKMEEVLGPGGQLGSFEAVFSPRTDHGTPAALWNRQTGAVDPEVASAWMRYDISRQLTDNWSELRQPLAGKIHVFMGAEDTFYLEGATRLLAQRLNDLGSDAVIEIVPGRDHSSLLDENLRNRIRREMAAAFLKSESTN